MAAEYWNPATGQWQPTPPAPVERGRFEDMSIPEKLWSGAVDPLKEGYYGIKQLAQGGELDAEDQQAVRDARERRDAAGGWGTAGEIATWLIPFGAAGKAGATAGRVAARALPKVAARFAPAAGAIAGEAALEGLYGASQAQLTGDPSRLERAARGAAAGAAGGVLGEAAGRVGSRLLKAAGRPAAMTPEAMQVERAGARMGTPINLTAGQAVDPRTTTGSMVRVVEEMGQRLPGGGPLRRAREAAMARWNLAEIRDALPQAMRSQVTEAGPKGMRQINALFDDAYGKVLAPIGRAPLDLTDDAMATLQGVERMIGSRIDEATQPSVRSALNNLVTDFAEGRLRADSFKEWRKALRTKASTAAKRGDMTEAQVYEGMLRAVDQSVEDRLGSAGTAALKEVDAAYSRIMPLVQASDMKGAVGSGYFTPGQMLSGARRGQTTWQKAQAGDRASQRALAAEGVFGTTLPQVGPGTAEKLATQALIGGLGASVVGVASGQSPGDALASSGLAGAVAGPLVGATMGSRAARRALLGRTRSQRALRRNRRGLERASGRTAGTALRSGAIVSQRDDDEDR